MDREQVLLPSLTIFGEQGEQSGAAAQDIRSERVSTIGASTNDRRFLNKTSRYRIVGNFLFRGEAIVGVSCRSIVGR